MTETDLIRLIGPTKIGLRKLLIATFNLKNQNNLYLFESNVKELIVA